METQPSMQDQFLALVEHIIEDNIGNENFSVSDLAKEVGLSRSMLHRKLIRLTGKSATDFITRIRLTRALELLESDVATVSEIAYRVGYSSPSYFNKVFKKTYNVSPGDVRNKGSGKISHLTVVKKPGTPDSTKSKKARSFIIAGINVFMIIIVAGGAVSLILGPPDNIFPFTRLPEWSVILIIVLFSGVFIISVILSWKNDLYPDQGSVQVEQTNSIKAGETHSLSNRWKIASYISIAAIAVLIILNIIPRANRKGNPEKSIAVLPFRNDSPDHENDHIINGTMEAILNNLSRISKLKVIPRTSVERYRNSLESIPEICRELHVSYALEGSMQKYGDQIRLTITLINPDDKNLRSWQYDREIKLVEEYYSLYSEIAQLVAAEIEAIITPEEKELIEKVPTSDMNAYYLYQKGNEEYLKCELSDGFRAEPLQRAEDFYHKAITHDPSFAQAYIGLANVHGIKSFFKDYHTEIYLDSALALANIALSLDPSLSDGYSIRGHIYFLRYQMNAAEADLNRALELNPNDWRAYRARGGIYRRNDHIKALENYYKAASLNRGPGMIPILRTISDIYYQTGIKEQVEIVGTQIFELTGDSALYYYYLCDSESLAGNDRQSLEYAIKSYKHDTSRIEPLQGIAASYSWLGEFEESVQYYEKFLGYLDDLTGGAIFNIAHRIGYAYWGFGDTIKAHYYFEKQVEFSLDQIELERVWASQNYFSYYDLAAIYAFRRDFQKAFEYLRIFNQIEIMEFWCISMLQKDPLFDSIRDEPEFQQIIRDVEAKYRTEHERVRKWLEENEML